MTYRRFRTARFRLLGIVERAVLNGAMGMALMAIERRLRHAQAVERKSRDA